MKNMCYLPWVGLDITPQGEFKPCCKYSNTVADNLTDYLDSTELAELKQSFLKNERPPACDRCWKDEDAGLPSKRQLDWKYALQEQAPLLDSYKILSLPFGNSCNLACRICDSYASSTWITQAKKLQKHIPIKIYKHQRFYQNETFMQGIKNLCSDVVHIEFPGGEPFLAGIQEHLDFLDYIIALNPGQVSLHYITNATMYPSAEFWSRWEKFKKVNIQLSIDGVGEQFEYNRWPGNWDQVNANVQLYTNQRSKISNIQLSVSHTVSIFTVYYLPEFVKWCLQNKLGKPYLGMLSDPMMYNVKTLPKLVKDKVSEKISRFNLENVVSYMYNEDFSNEFETSLKLIKILDQDRNQSFKTSFYEFHKLLKENDNA